MTIKLQKEITKMAIITQCSCGFESEDMDYSSGYNKDIRELLKKHGLKDENEK